MPLLERNLTILKAFYRMRHAFLANLSWMEPYYYCWEHFHHLGRISLALCYKTWDDSAFKNAFL